MQRYERRVRAGGAVVADAEVRPVAALAAHGVLRRGTADGLVALRALVVRSPDTARRGVAEVDQVGARAIVGEVAREVDVVAAPLD